MRRSVRSRPIRENKRRSSGGRTGSGWLRLGALLCILLIAAATTVQLCHFHPAQADGSTPGQTAPDHCPLCTAMHSALPASTQTAASPLHEMRELAAATPVSVALRPWALHRSIRPPPAA